MPSRVLAAAVGVAVLAGAGAAPSGADGTSAPSSGSASAKTFVYDVQFQTSGQNMWGPGAAQTSSDVTVPIIPTETWNTSGTARNIATDAFGAKWGGSISGSTDGQIGLALDLVNLNGGSISVDYPAQFVVSVAPPNGNQVTLWTGFEPQGGGTLSTTPPSGGVELSGSLGFHASASGDICVFACTGDFPIIPKFGFDPVTFSTPALTSSDKVPIFSLIPFLNKLGPSAAALSGWSGWVKFPSPSTSSSEDSSGMLTATGSDTFLQADINMAQWANSAVGDPIPLGFQIPPVIPGFDFGYSLFFAGAEPTLSEQASFTFAPAPTVTFTLDGDDPYVVTTPSGSQVSSGTGSSVTLPVGDEVMVTAPPAGVTLTPTFSLGNTFTPDISLLAANTWKVHALSIDAAIDGYSVDLGPVWSDDVASESGSFQVFGPNSIAGLGGGPQSWSLGGFPSQSEDPITVAPQASGSSYVLHGTRNSDGTFATAVELELDASSPDASLCGQPTIQYSTDGGDTWSTYDGWIPFLANGSYTVEFYSSDSCATEQPKSVSFTVDAEGPRTTASISGTLGTNGWYTSPVQLTVSAATDPGAMIYEIVAASGVNGAGAGSVLPDGPDYFGTGPFTQTVTADGEYYVHYTSYDSAGHEDPVEHEIDFKIDRTPPGVSMGAPPGGWYNHSVRLFESAEDRMSGIASVEYQIDDQGWLPYQSDGVVVTTEGQHTIGCRATDNAGNVTTVADCATVDIDETPPVTTFGSGRARQQGPATADSSGVDWTAGPVDVALSAYDPPLPDGTAGSGVLSTEYDLDGAGWTLYMRPFTVSTDGEHTLLFRSTDNAGNVEQVESYSFDIDATPPVTTAQVGGTQGNDGWYVAGQPATLTLTATDPPLSDGTPASGVATTYYSVNGGDEQIYDGPVVFGSGTYDVSYWSVDNAGNTEASHSIDLKVDQTPPETTLSPQPSGWVNTPQLVQLDSVDADSGVAYTSYSIDGGPTQPYLRPFVLGEGIHTVSYGATDVAGNVEAPESFTYQIDTTAPTTTAQEAPQPNAAGWHDGPVSVTLSATDPQLADGNPGSGVADTQYSVDGGPWTEYSGAVSVATEGQHVLQYRSTDVAGNVEAPQTLDVNVDETPPSTTAQETPQANGAGWYDAPVSVTLSASDPALADGSAGSGVATTEYSLDGGPWTAYSTPVSVADEGEHVLQYRSTDVAGNVENIQTLVLNVDETPPATTSQKTPEANAADWNNSAVVVTLSASDPQLADGNPGSGVAETEYSLDGGPWTAYAGPISVTSEGEHTLQYRSTDVAGNVEAPQTLDVNVDTTPPVIDFSGNAGTYSLTDTVQIDCAATDALSGIASTTCANVDAPASSFAPGLNTIDAAATDVAGNTTQASTSFTVDDTADGLCALARSWSGNRGIANAACEQLGVGNNGAHRPSVSQFDTIVAAQSGKAFTPDQAATLQRLASAVT